MVIGSACPKIYMPTVLVTGGAGFIGSHLSDRLIKSNYQVIILDNLSTGKQTYIPKSAIFIRGDVRRKQEVEAIFRKYAFDIVIHIAGQASTITSFTDPFFDIETNFLGTVNIVLSAVAHHVPRLLYASSMTVYGHPDKLPILETNLPRPISYYGITKYAAERFVHATAERIDLKKPLNVTSFRMFNVYGPRQSITNPYQGVLAIFIGNVLRGEPITIFGDGRQSRDFVYIDDVVDSWMSAIDNPKSFNQSVNIGSGRQTSILDLARAVITATNKDPGKYPIRYQSKRPGDQQFIAADIAKAKKLLGFRPKTSLSQGLAKTIAWAKQTALKKRDSGNIR